MLATSLRAFLPTGRSTIRDRVLLDLQSVGEADVQARSPGGWEEQLPPSIWWLVGKVPSLPDNPLHPGSLIYSASETKQKQTNLNAYRKTHINPLTSEALNLEPKFAQT